MTATGNGQLRLQFLDSPFCVKDEADLTASLTGDTNRCDAIAGSGVKATVSSTVSLPLDFGARARFRGLSAGAAVTSHGAGGSGA